MKICVLNDPSWGEPFNPEFYLKNHICEKHDVFYKSSCDYLKNISKKYDLFLNFCDAPFVEKRPGIDIVLCLEKLKVPFTGAYSFCYEPSRNKMKNICNGISILMPKSATVANLDRLSEKLVSHINYPMIVKQSNSYGSVGLTKKSKVNNFEELRNQVQEMLCLFQAVRIEEFIEGKEFSCLISQNPLDIKNPIAYEPVEINFPKEESFKHSDLKWIDYKKMSCLPVEISELSEEIKNICKKLFIHTNGRGYARCDLRMNNKKELYMLEINYQAGILYSKENPGTADTILLNEKNGHEKFMEYLIKSAFINVSLSNHII
jgi:D-alanine-D-alanine ligase